MAYAFDATIGGAVANSYATVEQLDTYFGGRYPADLWDSLPTADKQKIATTATRRIDQETFYGGKAKSSQSLQFPRINASDREGNTYQSNIIPQNLINAQAELIYFLLQAEDRNLSELDLHDAQSLDGLSVGPLNYSFKGKIKANQLPDSVKSELKALGCWMPGINPTVISR